MKIRNLPPPFSSPDMEPGDPLPVLTPSGGHPNTYGWQAGGTHPTGILSCFSFSFISRLLRCNVISFFL